MGSRETQVRVIPLGGLGEVGKNITAIDHRDGFILIDCGLTFPREQGVFGVDIVLPDFTWVEENADRLLGVVVTHGHEDHIGALAWLMRQVKVPKVWGTRFTLALAKARVDEFQLIDETSFEEVRPDDDPMQVGPFELEFIRVTHSIPDCVAVAVHTPHGTILHTGDIKLDPSPMDGVQTDLGHFAELGTEGVALYLADSTQADIPGHTKSERSLAGPLRDIVRGATGRIIVTCFSSHIHRIQQFCDIAAENGRKICIIGRSMTRNTNIARNLGYMHVDPELLIKPNQLQDHAPSDVIVLCTGSQGEQLAAMSRLAWGTHPTLQPEPDDTVIFSSRTIPGNELRVHSVINQLSRAGAQILHSGIAKVHVSGHGSSEELQTLLQLVRPRHFMPIHGEWRHLRAHADLAAMVGVDRDRIIMAENGSVVTLRNGTAQLSDEFVHAGERFVDRHSNEDIVQRVMDDRQQASGDGLLIIVAHEASGQLEVIPRGFLDDDPEMIDEVRKAAEEALDADDASKDVGEIEHSIQEAVGAVVHGRTRRSPLVVPVVLDD
jgi:ribonuclease J